MSVNFSDALSRNPGEGSRDQNFSALSTLRLLAVLDVVVLPVSLTAVGLMVVVLSTSTSTGEALVNGAGMAAVLFLAMATLFLLRLANESANRLASQDVRA